jgi:signal transduction histidine kinase
MGPRGRSTLSRALLARLPRRTARLRLALLYGGLSFTSGAALLLITDLLWGNATNGRIAISPDEIRAVLRGVLRSPSGSAIGPLQRAGPTPKNILFVGQHLHTVTDQQHSSDLHHLILFSAVAVPVMVILSLLVGWFAAGRVLRPLRTISSTAKDISATNLHKRLELGGPDDELKELGDTFDGLLERLDGAFQSQSQFVANASHELRTPLATMRASVDVAMAKTGRSAESRLNTLASRLRGELDHADRLLESLLALARARRTPGSEKAIVTLDDLVARAVSRQGAAVLRKGITVRHHGDSGATVRGNEVLLAGMIDNVIDNAVKHNELGGFIEVATEVSGGEVRLTVENGGPTLADESVAELAQPFKRAGAERTGTDEGSGLGLSIVAAVAESHEGHLRLQARPGGGLFVLIVLPAPDRALAAAPA